MNRDELVGIILDAHCHGDREMWSGQAADEILARFPLVNDGARPVKKSQARAPDRDKLAALIERTEYGDYAHDPPTPYGYQLATAILAAGWRPPVTDSPAPT